MEICSYIKQKLPNDKLQSTAHSTLHKYVVYRFINSMTHWKYNFLFRMLYFQTNFSGPLQDPRSQQQGHSICRTVGSVKGLNL